MNLHGFSFDHCRSTFKPWMYIPRCVKTSPCLVSNPSISSSQMLHGAGIFTNIYQHLPTFTLNITQFCSIILLYQHGAVLAWTATHQTTTHQNFQPKLQALQKALFVPLWSSAARPEIWGFKQEVKQSQICGIILADVLTVTSSLSLDLSSFFQLRLRQDVQSHCVDHGLVTLRFARKMDRASTINAFVFF